MQNCKTSAGTAAQKSYKCSLLARLPLLLAILLLCAVSSQAQVSIGVGQSTTGFTYSPGIQWTENQKQDSVLKIYIEGDTMTAIRNLLVYCLQEKSENDNANIVLSMINLDYLKKIFKSKEFNYYLSEYAKAKAKNKKVRKRDYPMYEVSK